MENFRRTKVSTSGFVGYRFTRVRRASRAGFVFGFALKEGAVPGVLEPPEAVAYAFVRPPESRLYGELVARRASAVRRLVASSHTLGFPFEFHPEEEVAAVRHRSLRRVPREIFPLVASDFFMLCYQPIRSSTFLERVTKATTRPGP